VVLIHRVGVVPITESAVVVAVSAPHRDEAFLAARFGIDAIKASVPIWKHETWDGGESWGTDAQELVDANVVGEQP
jgi:molybdopterin synthase catalytic subunit